VGDRSREKFFFELGKRAGNFVGVPSNAVVDFFLKDRTEFQRPMIGDIVRGDADGLEFAGKTLTIENRMGLLGAAVASESFP
jgi:hypothetical protein